MIENKKIVCVTLFLATIFTLSILFASQVSAQCEDPSAPICIPDSTSTGLPDPGDGVLGVVTNVVNWLLGIFGVVALLGFVVSGIQYITAAGSEKTIETAKRNMTYSIIGVVIALSAVVIITAIDAALNATSSFF